MRGSRSASSEAKPQPVGVEEDAAGENEEDAKEDEAATTTADRAAATEAEVVLQPVEEPGKGSDFEQSCQAALISIVHKGLHRK